MKIIKKNINELKNDPANARKHSEKNIKTIKDSLEVFGQQKPIVVDNRGVVIAGNGTLQAATELGWEQINIVETSLDPAHAQAFGIADNRTAELAEWDVEVLDTLIKNMDSDLVEILAVDDIDFGNSDNVLGDKGAIDEVENLEPPEEPVAKYGETWELGRHVVLCGDSTDVNDVEKLLGDLDKYQLLADPPYNLGFNYAEHDDEMDEKDYQGFCSSWFELFISKAEGGAVTCGPRNIARYPRPKDHGYWLKRNATAGASLFYLRTVEPILFYGNFKEKRTYDLFDYTSGFKAELKDALKDTGAVGNHPPSKSTHLWLEIISMFNDGVIVDPFSGSGTTVLCSETLGKTARVMEKTPRYLDLMIHRWEALTGEKALLRE